MLFQSFVLNGDAFSLFLAHASYSKC